MKNDSIPKVSAEAPSPGVGSSDWLAVRPLRDYVPKSEMDDRHLALACSAFLEAHQIIYGDAVDARIGQHDMVCRSFGVPGHRAPGPTLWEAMEWHKQAAEEMESVLKDCLAGSPLNPFERGDAIRRALNIYARAKLWMAGRNDYTDDNDDPDFPANKADMPTCGK